MLVLHNFMPQSFTPSCEAKSCDNTHACSSVPCKLRFTSPSPVSGSYLEFISPTLMPCIGTRKPLTCFARAKESKEDHNPETSLESDYKPETRNGPKKGNNPEKGVEAGKNFHMTIPRKPRRGRKSEAAAVEDFIRDSLEQTFSSIQQQNPEIFQDKENILKEKVKRRVDPDNSDDEDSDEEDEKKEMKMVVEEEDPNWPLDADVGWGIRASEYFEQHPIKNITGEDGVEIDWEGELDDNWVQEINCLEWEAFAFHPSPLVVLVFERYNRASENWKALKELEKAVKVFWSSKDRLPPRAVKIDINIERDLAYALKAKECPQILFLGKNRILYREKEIRTADELVQMIAYFYYNAKKPSWVDDAALKRPF